MNPTNEPRRALFVCPDFPPSGYPPALRARFFARHLPEFGWQPIILTVRPEFYEWRVDPEEERLLPPSLEVMRTSAWSQGWTRRLGLGELGLRSMWPHWQAIQRLCRASRPDLLFIPMPPFYTAVLGRRAADCFQIPYVVDYIDPWVSDYWKREPGARRCSKRGLADALARLLEPYALRRASHLTGVSKGTTDGVIRRCRWLRETDTTEIPYGGEPADFDHLRRHSRANRFFQRGDGCLHISYVGRGGHDMIPAVRAMFQAMRLGRERNPALFSRVRMHFIGTTYAHQANGAELVLPAARESGLADIVAEHPQRVPYLDALQILLDSDVLAVFGSHTTHYTASKIFPYILARRPLLAIFHEASSVVKILRDTRAGEVVVFTSERGPETQIEAITARLETLLKLPPRQEPPTRWQEFEAYTARAMTARLAKVFDGVFTTAGAKHVNGTEPHPASTKWAT